MVRSSWGSPASARHQALAQHRAKIAKEIHIEVGQSGKWYRIEDEFHRAYSDAEEKRGGPTTSGQDKGEETRVW